MIEQSNENGFKLLPFVIINTATMVNGEYVWYKSKWKNMLLKIKHFFVKPKYIKNMHLYTDKKIESSNYMTINILE